VERHATIDIPHQAALDDVPDFEDAHPLDILRWAGDRFGDGIVVTASFGDATLVHLVSQAVPEAEVVLLDTGYLFAETEWYAEELRRAYDLNLRVVAPPTDAVHNLWQTDTDACCAARKVAPLQQALAGKTGWITGLRRADSPSRADAPIVHFDPFRDITKINPMATWSDAEVAHYNAIELLPEHPLTAKGYVSIGCWPCTRPVKEGEDVRAGRWSGSGKTECGLHSSPGSTTGGVAEPDPA
jgi:phosphoadenosine phosphosulfate reductase